MAGAEGGRRRRSAAANDERILDAAVAHLEQHGVDQLSLTKIAKAAGLTSGATYARFDDGYDLAAVLWEQRLGAPLIEHLRTFIRWGLSGDASSTAVRMGRLAASPPHHVRCGIVLLAGANHVPELDDLVPRALQKLCDDEGCGPDAPNDVRIAAMLGLGTGLGVLLQHPVSPVSRSGIIDFTRMIGHLIDHPGPNRPVEPETPPPLVLDGLGDLERDLFIAAFEVVAQVGVARASLGRIARRAGYSVSRIYELGDNRSEFIARMTKHGIVPGARAFLVGTSPSSAIAANAQGWVADRMATRRRFNLELFAASHHDPVIRSTFRDVQRTFSREQAETLRRLPGALGRLAVVTNSGAPMYGAGLQAAQTLMGGLDTIDWSPAFTELGAEHGEPPAAKIFEDAR
jgi:AcrR family transcriptional regulator